MNEGKGAVNGGSTFNMEAQEMLGKVPGVTPKNIRNITAEAESVREVANMEAEELGRLVGREAAGKIVEFFKKDVLEDYSG